MRMAPELCAEDVDAMMAAADAHARAHGWLVAIAVCDPGGHPLAFRRLDGVATICSYVAVEKARAAALGKRETAQMEKTLNEGRLSYLTIPGAQALMEGGLPILHEGRVLGGIGVSGAKSADDAAIARAGISALVWPTTPGETG